MNWRQGVAEELNKAFMHRPEKDAMCVACGATGKTYGMHVIEYYHDERSKAPSYLIPTSNSRETTRGVVPLCHDCCPPCRKCGLPIATAWVKKLVTRLTQVAPEVSFRIGNGYCTQHLHVWNDVRALFRPVDVAIHRDPPPARTTPDELRKAWEASFDQATKHPVWGFIAEPDYYNIEVCLDNARRECELDRYSSTNSVPEEVLEEIYIYATWLHQEKKLDIRIPLIMIHQFIDTDKAVREAHWDNWCELMHARSEIAPEAESYVEFVQSNYIDRFGEWTLGRD